MSRADAQAMPHPLDETARSPASKTHTVVLDPAGEHAAGKLRLPETLCLPPLPSNSPASNPVENLRRFLHQNKLSNRISSDDEAIVIAAGEAMPNHRDAPSSDIQAGRRYLSSHQSSRRLALKMLLSISVTPLT